MAVNAENVKLGVCTVTYGGTDLGVTKGGVELTLETQTHEVRVDQTGQTPINEYIMGRTISVKVPLAETALENMVAVIPGATLIGIAPVLHVDVAQPLILHPVTLASTDKSEDVTIYKAGTSGVMSFAYKIDDERIFNVEFKAYPDDSKDGNLMGYGDPAATSV